MAKLRISSKALTYYIKSDDNSAELEMILCRDDVGEVINRSDVLKMGNLEEIIEVEIPAQVKSINPGAFVGNLYKQVLDSNIVASMSGHAEGSRAFSRYRVDREIKTNAVNLVD